MCCDDNKIVFVPFTGEQFSKGPMLNCSMVVKYYKMYLMLMDNNLFYCPSSLCQILSNIATFYNHAKNKQGTPVKLLCE